jgi:formylglycine-generating enzyme required for sulfatase activity
MRPLVWASAAALLIIAGCGGGTDDLTGDAGRGRAAVLVADLATGAVDPAPSLAEAMALPGVGDRLLVLVRADAGAATGGSAGDPRWGLPDETAREVTHRTQFVAVTELTRGQWRHLAGDAPWDDFPAELTGSGDRLPAVGMSADRAMAVLGAASARMPGVFLLPDADTWESLCRAGTAGRFSWGDAIDAVQAAAYAVTADTAPAVDGPAEVGSLLANPLGLHDMHGNAWEMDNAGDLHGGSWHDPLPMARSANRVAHDRGTGHPLVGLRPIYNAEDP